MYVIWVKVAKEMAEAMKPWKDFFKKKEEKINGITLKKIIYISCVVFQSSQ